MWVCVYVYNVCVSMYRMYVCVYIYIYGLNSTTTVLLGE